ncbi:hypothetical protein G5I_07458 [Acromyrmex echinatior]|uniref:Uncharacterized protein n=1 Tax=Acromyrmex echinatior TaxID=103372 RepID=F4WNV1_ACREC|nr:hypothetical protein G5I_07458 [Acromyrmex echinatior]
MSSFFHKLSTHIHHNISPARLTVAPYARAVFRGEPQKSSPQMRRHVKSSSVTLAGTFVTTLRDDGGDEFAVTGIQRVSEIRGREETARAAYYANDTGRSSSEIYLSQHNECQKCPGNHSANVASAAARWLVIRLTGNRPLRDSFTLTKPSPSCLTSYLLFLQGGCDEGSRLRGARVAQAPVEECRKDAAFLESLIKPAAASNHRRKHRRLQLPARRRWQWHFTSFVFSMLKDKKSHVTSLDLFKLENLLKVFLLTARSAGFRFQDRKRFIIATKWLIIVANHSQIAIGDDMHPRKASPFVRHDRLVTYFDLAGNQKAGRCTTRRTAHGAYPVNEIALARAALASRAQQKAKGTRKEEGRPGRG